MKRAILLILMLFSTKVCSFEHFLTVCAIFRDDAPYLKEWIEFHIEQGVEHFYLYNNMSKDNYSEVLQPFIEKGVLTLTEWPGEHKTEDQWTHIQCSSYMDCVKRIRETSKWCAFIDTDEFLFSPKGKLPYILKRYEKYGGVCVNWLVYGTSKVSKIPYGEKIIDYLSLRASDDYIENLFIKTIAQPRLVTGCNSPHTFLYVRKKRAVTENFKNPRGMTSKQNSVHWLRINHYQTRDEDFFYNVKMPRSKNWNNKNRKQIELLNAVYDPILSSSR